jgi:hypothetical protein
MISKQIEKLPNEGEMLVCEFVNGGTCHTEPLKMEKFNRPDRSILFALAGEEKNRFGKIQNIECTQLKEKLAPPLAIKMENGFVGNVCPQDEYTLHFQADKKVNKLSKCTIFL